MDLLSLVMMCSVSGAPAVQDIAYQLAASVDADPWHIEDQTSGLIYDPSSLAEATAMASARPRTMHSA